jgi:hypothetical protein
MPAAYVVHHCMHVGASGDDDQGAGISKKVDEKTDGVVIIDAVGTILMVNKVR